MIFPILETLPEKVKFLGFSQFPSGDILFRGRGQDLISRGGSAGGVVPRFREDGGEELSIDFSLPSSVDCNRLS